MKNSQNNHLDFRRLRSQSNDIVISLRLEKRIKVLEGLSMKQILGK
jgi:hypothetical protein